MERYTTDLFKSDVAQELQLQFVAMVRALRLEPAADFETRINAAVGEILGRPFDVRTHIQEAIASHAKAAAQGLKKKFSEYDVFPGFCIFPAHLIALARCLGFAGGTGECGSIGADAGSLDFHSD